MRSLLAIFVSLLPEHRRARFAHDLPLSVGTGLSGAMQVMGALAAARVLFLAWASDQLAHADGNVPQMFAHGLSAYIAFLVLTPGGWLCLWLFVEGMVRIAASIAGEPVGTAPLAFADGAVTLLRDRLRAPPAPDRVFARGDELIVERATPIDWDRLTTFEHEGKHYCLAAKEEIGGVWRQRYVLRAIDDAHVIRKIVRLS